MFELLFLSKALCGEEFVPVDLEADSSDSHNNIFIFIIGIRATSRIKPLFFKLCLDCSCFAVATYKGMRYDYGLFICRVHILSFLKMYLFVVLFLVVHLLLLYIYIYFKRMKTVRVSLWRLE